MSLPNLNLNGEIITPKFHVNEHAIKINIEEVNSLLKDARLLALERDQYALFGIIDMIIERFKIIAKCVEPPSILNKPE